MRQGNLGNISDDEHHMSCVAATLPWVEPDPGLKYQIKDGVVNREIVVHQFEVDCMYDTVLYAAEPLHKWEQSEEGQWVISHAVEQPRWLRFTSCERYTDNFAIAARLSEPDITFWMLKYA